MILLDEKTARTQPLFSNFHVLLFHDVLRVFTTVECDAGNLWSQVQLSRIVLLFHSVLRVFVPVEWDAG